MTISERNKTGMLCVCEIMQKKARVALDEGYIFGDAGRGFERINIATPRSVVEDCMDRILKAFKEEKLV